MSFYMGLWEEEIATLAAYLPLPIVYAMSKGQNECSFNKRLITVSKTIGRV